MMETIDFGCQVRCLNRQKLIPGSTHPQLNQCASKFLAKVRKEILSSGDQPINTADQSGWMKLKLSERGLRIIPAAPVVATTAVGPTMATASTNTPSFFSSSTSILSLTDSVVVPSGSSTTFHLSSHRKSDEGFESDSEHSFDRYHRSDSHHHSGGCSSGVNSSSSDLEEPPESASPSRDGLVRNSKRPSENSDDDHYPMMTPVRCGLSDILSCQHPPALGRYVVLLTLRSTDDSALDILALECSAEEPARILTLLCQKIASNPAISAGSLSTSPASTSDAGSVSSGCSNGLVRSASSKHKKFTPESSTATATVSVQSWSDREKMLDALIDEHKPAVSAQNIIRQLERQHSEWNLIQRRTEDGLTHLQVSSPQQMKCRQQQQQQSGAGHNKAATTSGGVLKKAMPSGSSLGHSGRQETDHHLAITNSHQSSGSRTSGVSVNGVVLVSSSDVKATHHHHPSGLKRSDTTTMHQKLVGTSKPINGHLHKKNASASCILSLQTPELPLPTVANASTSTADAPVPPPTKSRWSFGAPFRSSPASTAVQRRQLSPEVSRRSEKQQQQRGRSCDRKSSKTVSSAATAKVTTPGHSELANLFIASSGFNKKKTDQRIAESSGTQNQPTKIKRDPSKTRSFLMKLTSSSRKSPTPPVSPPASILSLNDGRSAQRTTDVDGGRQRGRSLVRLRSSARFQSPPPPPSSSIQQQQQTAVSQTFLIPTKSGQELTRHIYPKETSCRSVNGSAPPPPPQPVFHLLTGGGRASHRYNGPVTGPSGWAGYCWPGEMASNGTGVGGLRHPAPYSDTNNNQPQQQQQQQQWIYFHPHHHGVSAAAIKASNDLKRIQRSRSQSPGRRNSQRMAMASAPSSLVISPLIDMHPPRWLAPPPVGHYYAVPSTTAQPVSLPPDVSHLTREAPPSRSFRRSKSSTRLSARQSKSDRHGSSSNIGSSTDRLSGSSNNKAVTFHAFATVQLVD